MFLQKLISITNRLEDPAYPSLGPIIKSLRLFGLWHGDQKLRNAAFLCLHAFSLFFVISQFIDLYNIRDDINMVLNNMSVASLSIICIFKTINFIYNMKYWQNLIHGIAKFELDQLKARDKTTMSYMLNYFIYTRIITNLYWSLVFVTNLFLLVSPFMKLISAHYRENVYDGSEPLPQILFSWFPFDNKEMPGYLIGICIHIVMGCQGSGVVAAYDMNAVAIMSYLRGQMIILREKCREIFDGEEITRDEVLRRIRECHKAHNVLTTHFEQLNTLLSPLLFLYVLLSSLTICFGVVQFTSKNATAAQKFWVVEYTLALIMQLFLYCWHSNEVAVESTAVDRGVYESKWWKADKKLKKQILLLAGKLDKTMTLEAGHATLSVATFIEILKGSYSFYTLFSQMQDN